MSDLQHRINAIHSSGRPWVIGKAAMSLNGKMTRPVGEGQWISSKASRHDVQLLRSQCDAILVGATTACTDNPSLTVREIEILEQPWRVVITHRKVLPHHLKLLSDEHHARTLILNNLSWTDIWHKLFERGIRTVLVEGGGNILNQLAERQFIDESIIYYAPYNLEGEELVTAAAFRQLTLIDPDTTIIGNDLRISGIVER